MKRTRLEMKYGAIKKLELSQRTHGLEFVPKFREVAREVELPPQLLVELWRRRLLIIERAKRKLPEETLIKIDKETSLKITKEAVKVFCKIEQTDLDKLPMRKFIKLYNELCDAQLKLMKCGM